MRGPMRVRRVRPTGWESMGVTEARGTWRGPGLDWGQPGQVESSRGDTDKAGAQPDLLSLVTVCPNLWNAGRPVGDTNPNVSAHSFWKHTSPYKESVV